jgi:hypothetical protein
MGTPILPRGRETRTTDDFPGLNFTAYLMREEGVDWFAINQYASFRLWNDTSGMGELVVAVPSAE